jgi:hypothetical protein
MCRILYDTNRNFSDILFVLQVPNKFRAVRMGNSVGPVPPKVRVVINRLHM